MWHYRWCRASYNIHCWGVLCSYVFIGWSARFVADCSMKHDLANLCLIHCTCWDNYPYMVCNLISQKFRERALSLTRSKIGQHVKYCVDRSLNQQFGVSYNNFAQNKVLAGEMGSKLYGCMFPGSLCHTQTETNGNVPCSLILLLYLQYASRDKLCGYVQINSDK